MDNKYFDSCSSSENVNASSPAVDNEYPEDNSGGSSGCSKKEMGDSAAGAGGEPPAGGAAENTEWYEYGCV